MRAGTVVLVTSITVSACGGDPPAASPVATTSPATVGSSVPQPTAGDPTPTAAPTTDPTSIEEPIDEARVVVESPEEFYAMLRLTVEATPDTVDDIVPSVWFEGEDLFPTHCEREERELEGPARSFVCDGLVADVHDVSATTPDGDELLLACAPYGRSFDWVPTLADLGPSSFAECRLSGTPAGVLVELRGVAPDRWTALEIRSAGGDVVEAGCRVVEFHDVMPSSGLTHVWCDRLPIGEYEIPRQDVDGSGVVQPFSCSPAMVFDHGPRLDQTFRLEDSTNELGADQSVWTCENVEPAGPLEAKLMLGLEADSALVDELRIEVIRDGVDIHGVACVPAEAPEYLDPGVEGFRFWVCEGDWWGQLAPRVANAPAGSEVAVTCFEEQPITKVIGPTAILDPEIGEPWICVIRVT